MRYLGRAWLARGVFGIAVLLFIACQKRYVEVPIEQIEQRRPFRAVVEKISVDDFGQLPSGVVVVIGLRTEGGERIAMGGVRARDDLIGFARTLEKGKTYEFPTVWIDYRFKHRQ